MTTKEKILYHQIHPAKLAVDWGCTPPALYFFWMHELLPALLVSFLPSILASLLIIRFIDLTAFSESGAGRYLKRFMTRAMEAIRLAGFLLMAIGAWTHIWWIIPLGVAVVLFGWMRGLLAAR